MNKPEFRETPYWIDPQTGDVMMTQTMFEFVRKMEDAEFTKETKALIENLQAAAATHYLDASLFFSEEAMEMLTKAKNGESISGKTMVEFAEKIQDVLTRAQKEKSL